MTTPNDKTDDEGRKKIRCHACKDNSKGDKFYHRLDLHLAKKHDMSVADYQALYPGKPVLSAYGREMASEAIADGAALDPELVSEVLRVMKSLAEEEEQKA